MIADFVEGFLNVLTPLGIFYMIAGVIIGIIFGSIPGLTATMAIAIFLSITYSMTPGMGLSLLCALYIGGISGGLISAILLHMPGTPSSVATCFDGYPMAKKGEAGKALGTGIVFSFLGSLFSFVALFFIAPQVAKFAVKLGPYELFSLGIFSLSMICVMTEKGSMSKGIGAGCIGLAIGIMGIAPIDGASRLTFGIPALSGGVDTLPLMIGVFVIPEIIISASEKYAPKGIIADFHIKGFGFSFHEFLEQIPNAIRSALIGLGIGILPGIGGGTSNILAYTVAKTSSKNPEKFGTGIMDGIVASETANNATIGGAMIPLLCLGIPGDTTTAMLIGAFTIHGISPGPLLFTSQRALIYTIFAALFISNILMIIIEFWGLRVFVQILKVPKYILLPIIFMMCVIGAFAISNNSFDVMCVAILGIVAYYLKSRNINLVPIILGYVLGSSVETNLRRAFQLGNGNFLGFFTHPISLFFLILAVVVVILTACRMHRNDY